MRRALMYVVIAALGFAALKHIRVGHTTLWAEAQQLWRSKVMQSGVKSMGDPLLDHLRPKGGRSEGGKSGGPQKRHDAHRMMPASDTYVADGDGPGDDRDLPPAPIPPPKEPLEASV